MTCTKNWKEEFLSKVKEGDEVAKAIAEAKDSRAAEAYVSCYSKTLFISMDDSFKKYVDDEFVKTYDLLIEKGADCISDYDIEQVKKIGWAEDWTPVKDGSIVSYRMVINDGDFSIEGKRLDIIWDNGNDPITADRYLSKVLQRSAQTYFPEDWIEDWFHTGTYDKWSSIYHSVNPYDTEEEWDEEVNLEAVKAIEGTTGLLPVEIHGKKVVLADFHFPVEESFPKDEAMEKLHLDKENDILYFEKVENNEGVFLTAPFFKTDGVTFVRDMESFHIYKVTSRGLEQLNCFTNWDDIKNPKPKEIPDWLE